MGLMRRTAAQWNEIINSCFRILLWGPHNDLKVPEKPQTMCTGFTYFGSKAFNMLPKNIKEAQTTNVFNFFGNSIIQE